MKKGLLLGAGFSYDLGMPLVADITPIFLGLFNKSANKRLADHILSIDAYGSDRPINRKAIETGLELMLLAQKNSDRNYEQIISKFQRREGLSNPTQSDRDSYHYLFSFCYSIIHEILCMYQRASYEILYPANKQWFSEFESLLSESETWTFTLNHDLCVECLALDMGIPITYGEMTTIKFPVSNLEMQTQIEYGVYELRHLLSENSFFKEQRGINLVKLHGGLSEQYYKDKTLCLNLRLNKPSSKELIEDFLHSRRMAYYMHGRRMSYGDADRIITNIAGELDILSGSMLTGENKFSKTSNPKKGEEKLQLFDQTLQNLDELTIIGYSFGDRHINFRISNALVLNPRLRLRIIDPGKPTRPESIDQFDYGDRIGGAQCGAALWMYYCKYQKWNNTQIQALKNSNRNAVKMRVDELMKQL